MSVVRTFSLQCDHPECVDAEAWNQDLGYDTAAGVRRMAKANGWTRRGSRDFCPEHSDSPSPSQGGGTDG